MITKLRQSVLLRRELSEEELAKAKEGATIESGDASYKIIREYGMQGDNPTYTRRELARSTTQGLSNPDDLYTGLRNRVTDMFTFTPDGKLEERVTLCGNSCESHTHRMSITHFNPPGALVGKSAKTTKYRHYPMYD